MSVQQSSVTPRAVVIGALACLLVLAALAAFTIGPGVPSVDVSLSTRLHQLASPRMDQLVPIITDLGSTGILTLVTALAVAVLAWRGRRVEAVFVVLALVATLLLNGALKLIVARPRPELEWSRAQSGFSFPSGHSMNAFVIYIALAIVVWALWGRRAGIVALALALVLALAVGLSRVYLGVHWPTDVAAGFVAGILCLLLVGAVAAAGRRLLRRSAADADRHP